MRNHEGEVAIGLGRIASLYAVEADIGGQAADERRRVRQERSRPIIEALQTWLKAQLDLVSQKGKLAEATRGATSPMSSPASSRAIPTAGSTRSCPRPTSRPSAPWPDNSAYPFTCPRKRTLVFLRGGAPTSG